MVVFGFSLVTLQNEIIIEKLYTANTDGCLLLCCTLVTRVVREGEERREEVLDGTSMLLVASGWRKIAVEVEVG